MVCRVFTGINVKKT